MAPKDKGHMTKKNGVIYRYKCDEDGCDAEYFGESARTFAERFKEHQKAPFPIFDHCNISGHKVTIDNFTIVGRDNQNLIRAIKEALFIRVNDQSLNRNIGKYHLPHIWDKVLHKTSEEKNKTLTQWLFYLPLGYNSCQFHTHGRHSISHLGNDICQNMNYHIQWQ